MSYLLDTDTISAHLKQESVIAGFLLQYIGRISVSAACAICLLCCISGCGQPPSAETVEGRRMAESLPCLNTPEELVLYSIDGREEREDVSSSDEQFHGYPTLGNASSQASHGTRSNHRRDQGGSGPKRRVGSRMLLAATWNSCRRAWRTRGLCDLF